MPHQGKVAVITGGAAGIGAAAATMWVEAGGKAVICDLDDERGQAFVSEHAGEMVFMHCDATVQADLQQAADAAKRLGALTCWFNNAGIASPRDTLEDTLENIVEMKRLVDVNVTAHMVGTYIALASFDPTHGGVIISTASMAGLLPVGAPPVYSMSKAANIQLTRAVASALGEGSNIRAYALCPSYTATAMGPDPALIKAALGGVLQAKHQAEGFMMLADGTLPNGSVMRVTARKHGAVVVHDLVAYGKEQGGQEPPRAGIVVKTAPLEEYTSTSKL